MALKNALGDITLEETQVDVRDLLETIVILLASLVEKMPRTTTNDQQAVAVETGTIAVSSLPTLANVTNLATLTSLTNAVNLQNAGSRFLMGDNLNYAGLQYIYNNIEVS